MESLGFISTYRTYHGPKYYRPNTQFFNEEFLDELMEYLNAGVLPALRKAWTRLKNSKSFTLINVLKDFIKNKKKNIKEYNIKLAKYKQRGEISLKSDDLVESVPTRTLSRVDRLSTSYKTTLIEKDVAMNKQKRNIDFYNLDMNKINAYEFFTPLLNYIASEMNFTLESKITFSVFQDDVIEPAYNLMRKKRNKSHSYFYTICESKNKQLNRKIDNTLKIAIKSHPTIKALLEEERNKSQKKSITQKEGYILQDNNNLPVFRKTLQSNRTYTNKYKRTGRWVDGRWVENNEAKNYKTDHQGSVNGGLSRRLWSDIKAGVYDK